MKIRSLLALAGLAISFGLPTFAQEHNAVDPEVGQQIAAVNTKLGEAQNKQTRLLPQPCIRLTR